MALGIGSEAGEICGKIKKIFRDGGGEITAPVKRALMEEAGDLCWYLSQLAHELDTTLEDCARLNIAKLKSRKERGVIQGSGDAR